MSNVKNYLSPLKRRSFRVRATVVTVAAFALVAMATSSARMFAPIPGAIFTTVAGCPGTNQNIFSDKGDVYLDGGPTHPGAAGLPDGDYWVQVTEPDGTLLGRSTSANTHVAGGEFALCYRVADIVNTNSSGLTTPGYDTTTNGGGVYKLWVSTEATFTNSNTKTDNFKIKCTENCGGTPPQGALSVVKFYDADANGLLSAGDLPIPGWRVRIVDNIDIIRFTPVVNLVVDPDLYTVTESTPVETNWISTGNCVRNNLNALDFACQSVNPTVAPVNVNDGDQKTIEFGNVCLGRGGGLTLGFWSNKNGQALTTTTAITGDLAFLTSLCLRNANGSDYDPSSIGKGGTSLSSWLLNATATNMAYMLSAQLTAMELNVRHGFVNGNALIYAPGTTSANPLGFATVNAVMAEANAELCAHPNTTSGTPGETFRAHQEAVKNALDKANNNLNFVQSNFSQCPYNFAQ